MTKQVVYTALLGRYERLLEQPISKKSSCTFICFTDDPELRSDTWQVVQIQPVFPLDPVRSARLIKIRGGFAAEESLWIDNRVRLTRPPEDLLAAALGDSACLAIPDHSFRSTVDREFAAVLRSRRDDPRRVREQHWAYALSDPAALDERPLWTGLIARKVDPGVARFTDAWAAHVLRYSRRDQLSVNLVLRAHPIAGFRRFQIPNLRSDYHEWVDPKDAGRFSASQPNSKGFAYRTIERMQDASEQLRIAGAVRRIRYGRDFERGIE